jgi:hypothetical protein
MADTTCQTGAKRWLVGSATHAFLEVSVLEESLQLALKTPIA